jgi:hypothetical protein
MLTFTSGRRCWPPMVERVAPAAFREETARGLRALVAHLGRR